MQKDICQGANILRLRLNVKSCRTIVDLNLIDAFLPLLKTDKLARLVIDLEDYDIPLTSAQDEYPNLTIGIGESSDLFVLTPTMPGVEIDLELLVAPEGWDNHQVATNGGIRKFTEDTLTTFEKCRIMRQLSRYGLAFWLC